MSEGIFQRIEETPLWVWGVVGALAFGYRSLRNSNKPTNLSLTSIGIDSCVGYAVCVTIPVFTPIAVIGIAYEDYHRRSKD